MRAKMVGIFALGFACGVFFLTLALWFSGGLKISSVIAGSKMPVPAAGIVTPSLHLAMPIAGIDPEKLDDTFNAVHGGHKHEALDIMAPRGTPVLAVADGNVVKLFTSTLGGLTVYQFDITQTYCYYYAHLDRYAAGLKENSLLRKGDVLGYVGSTGNAPADAPHLHFAVTILGPDKKWWEGEPIDPLPLLK